VNILIKIRLRRFLVTQYETVGLVIYAGSWKYWVSKCKAVFAMASFHQERIYATAK